MRKFYILVGILAVVAGGIAVALIIGPSLDGGTSASSGVVVEDEAEIAERALAFVQPPYRDNYGNMRIAGYVDNLGDRAFVSATLSIELRDGEGNRTATIEHVVPDVAAGKRTWFDLDAGTFEEPQSPTVAVMSLELAR